MSNRLNATTSKERLSEQYVEELVQQERLAIVPSYAASTGLMGVRSVGPSFQARAGRTSLGYFPTKQQASLAYSRHLGPIGSAHAAHRVSVQKDGCAQLDALYRARALEALKTERGATGFQGVYPTGTMKNGLFKAIIPHSAPGRAADRGAHLGTFDTAEEAVLAIVNKIGLAAAEQLRQATDHMVPVDPETYRRLQEEALKTAKDEGLTLVKGPGKSGFSCVAKRTAKRRARDSPAHFFYEALDGNKMVLGRKRTAAEAALIVARARASRSTGGENGATEEVRASLF